MSGPVQAKPANDLFINLALGTLIAAACFTGLLRVAGSVAAFLSGLPEPTEGFTSGVSVLATPTDPGKALGADGLNPILYWVIVTVFFGILGTAGFFVWRAVHQDHSKTDPHRLAGTATAAEVARVASAKALVKKAAMLRPSLSGKPVPADVGYLLGTGKGGQVWATVEDSILLIGPTRSGKGLHVVINAILDAPGAVITTSTRPDNLTRMAEHPDTPEQARTAAATELRTLHDAASPAEAAKESGLALARVTEIHKAATDPALIGWKDVDPLLREKHAIRKLVDLLRREHGWWDRYDPEDFGTHADDAQWELVTTSITESHRFLDLTQRARESREETHNANV